MLALAPPDMSVVAVPGPEGIEPTPQQQVSEFNALEQQWEAYRKLAEHAAFDQYKGGSLAPVFAQQMHLRLVRSHMQELDSLYGEETGSR